MEEFELKEEKKYEIKKIGIDEYVLKYKGKEINFKSDIDTTKKIQSANAIGKKKLYDELAKNGETINKYVITTTRNGKTYQDNSNKIALEQAYIEQAMQNIFDEICKEKLGMSLIQLILDIGITEDEQEKFSEELGGALSGNFPV